jgi:GNAT superfamily N-acetyltransferase
MQTRRDDGYEIDTAPGRLDVKLVHSWLATDAYWALGRREDVMVRAVRNSLCFGLYAPDGQQIGFARSVTDLATFAWLCDVYVVPEARGKGLGTWLADSATQHLVGHGLRRVLLATRDAHGVYQKAGYAPLSKPERWMEILRESVSPAAVVAAGDVAHT